MSKDNERSITVDFIQSEDCYGKLDTWLRGIWGGCRLIFNENLCGRV